MPFAELDRIAVTTGPGSFTGLRVGLSAARGIALASDKPAFGLTTLAAFAAPYIASDDTIALTVAIDARHEHVYLQVFGPGGRTLVAPRIASIRDAVRISASGTTRIVGNAARAVAAAWPANEPPPSLVEETEVPDIILGRAARRGGERQSRHRRSRFTCAHPTRSRRPPRDCRADDAIAQPPVRARRTGAVGGRRPRRRMRIAKLHAASFRRGWSDGEFEQLLIERNVIAHRATRGRTLDGFHPLAHRRRRSGNPVRRGRLVPARPGAGADAAQSPSAAACGTWHARRVPRSRRGQHAGAAALCTRRISRGRPPARLLPARRQQCRAALVLRRDLA